MMDGFYSTLTLLLVAIIIPAQYFVYKKKAGFKNENAAKQVLANGVYSILMYAVLTLNQLINWNPTLEAMILLITILGGLIGLYFIQKRLQKLSNS